ncbi:hypothetical protein ACLMJK_005264 [Lecanora helva]
MHISWGHSSGSDPLATVPMQDSSADNVASLSATSPITSHDSQEGKASLNESHITANASESLGDGHFKSSKKTSKTTETVARAAKREISEKVREDWTWSPGNTPPKSPFDNTTEWRERESDSEYGPPSPVLNADPYRFDSPESVARPGVSKKRKRRMLLEEEMEWNDGLRTFQERRNAWTGAKMRPPSPRREAISPCGMTDEDTQLHTPDSSSTDFHSSSSSSLPPMLVPVAPSILPPDNPIRASIKPSTYPSIYDKIIIRGLTPTIPINLKDVVHAVVAGWKKDGEWPPKSETEKVGESQDVGTRGEGRRLARKGVGRVKKALGLGRGIEGPSTGGGGV